LWYNLGICLEGGDWVKPQQTSQGSWFAGKDLNIRPPEYEAEVPLDCSIWDLCQKQNYINSSEFKKVELQRIYLRAYHSMCHLGPSTEVAGSNSDLDMDVRFEDLVAVKMSVLFFWFLMGLWVDTSISEMKTVCFFES
jgi:hypothetical protein